VILPLIWADEDVAAASGKPDAAVSFSNHGGHAQDPSG